MNPREQALTLRLQALGLRPAEVRAGVAGRRAVIADSWKKARA